MPYDASADLRGILDAVGDAIVIVDRSLRILKTNAACTAVFGYGAHDLISQPVGNLFVSRSEQRVLASIRAAFDVCRERVWGGHLLGRHCDGRILVFEARITRYLKRGLRRYAVALREIGQSRRAARALELAARHDQLTALVNRAAFGEQLRRSIELAERADRGFALLLVDLDQFKELNDRAGHRAGDLVLRQVARRLQTAVRKNDVVGRLGGDEFGVILAPGEDLADGPAVAERLVSAVSRPFHVAGDEVDVGASVGIATFPADACDADLLLVRADLALYAAKSASRGSWRLYDPKLGAAAVARRTLESELRVAIRDGQLDLLYQPIVRISDFEVCGFEALIRWNYPTRGVLGPKAFIPCAERTRMIQPITEWVLGRASGDLSALPVPFSDLPVAVNISTRMFDQDGLVDIVARVAKQSRQPGTRLILEITEGALAEYPRSIKMLGEMRCLGVGVAIDDFGVGYSSLARLKKLPLDALKIDRSFIENLPRSSADHAIVDAIVRVANSLGVLTVAEGVETLDQLRHVVKLGCAQVQGYLIARPMAVACLPDWLERWMCDRAGPLRVASLGGQQPSAIVKLRPAGRPFGDLHASDADRGLRTAG